MQTENVRAAKAQGPLASRRYAVSGVREDLCQFAEVLGGVGEEELVTCASWATSSVMFQIETALRCAQSLGAFFHGSSAALHWLFQANDTVDRHAPTRKRNHRNALSDTDFHAGGRDRPDLLVKVDFLPDRAANLTRSHRSRTRLAVLGLARQILRSGSAKSAGVR